MYESTHLQSHFTHQNMTPAIETKGDKTLTKCVMAPSSRAYVASRTARIWPKRMDKKILWTVLVFGFIFSSLEGKVAKGHYSKCIFCCSNDAHCSGIAVG